MHCARVAALSALVVSIAAESASAYTVTLDPGTYQSAVNLQTRDGGGAAASATQLPTTVPESDGSAVTEGDSSVGTNWSLSNGAFQIVFDHTRAVAQDSYSQTYASLYFTVDEDVDYVLAGSYSAADETGRRTFLRTYLFDYTANVHLFNSEQLSDATPDEALTLGEQGGDAYNLLDGALTGTLAPGHDYQLFLISYIWNQGTTTDAPATATGSVALTFVPEPSSAILLSGGLLALAFARARTRR